jgi:hypothetical protein
MTKVKGPNGVILVFDVDDSTGTALASGLVGDGTRGYELVVGEEPAEGGQQD